MIAALLIDTAIYLAIHSRDNIQKWLNQCLWRRIPMNVESANKEVFMSREAADLPVWPDMVMEMNELKLALGVGI